MHALVKANGPGPSRHAKELLATLSTDRSLALVIDGNGASWAPETFPKGSDAYAWLRVDKDGATLDFALDPRNEAGAKKTMADIKPQVDDLFANTSKAAVGKLEVIREGTAVHVRGSLTGLMLGIITTAIP